MQNARIAMDQEQYQKEFDELVERHSRVKQEYEEQAIAAEQDVGRVAQIDNFISTLEKLNAPVTEFDEQLWISMVDHPFVFMDCIHYKVREDGRILSRAAYVVLGVTVEGYKDILSITVGANETSKFWLGMLNDLKNRGVKDVLGFQSSIQCPK